MEVLPACFLATNSNETWQCHDDEEKEFSWELPVTITRARLSVGILRIDVCHLVDLVLIKW